MRWVAPSEKDEANHQLEKRLWDAADQFRARGQQRRQVRQRGDGRRTIIRKRPEPVRARFQELDSGQLCISVASEAELLYGVKAKGSPRALASMVADFLRRQHFRRGDGLKVENWA